MLVFIVIQGQLKAKCVQGKGKAKSVCSPLTSLSKTETRHIQNENNKHIQRKRCDLHNMPLRLHILPADFY